MVARLAASLSLITALSAPFVAQHAAAQEAGSFEMVGHSGVSAMMMFLGTENKVYIQDKTENNSLQVGGHPAWATEYDLETQEVRPMDIRTNTFCAAGVVLGDGSWINAGGNLAVSTNNSAVPPDGPQDNVYDTVDGRRGLRLLHPCDDESCNWRDDAELQMNSPRWYPTLETLPDGDAIIIGGSVDGGYLNPIDNPTYEYHPRRGDDINMTFLADTYPLNLYPLTWLLPDGRLFIQSDYGAINFDHENNEEFPLPDIPHAFRVYPASGASWLSPLLPETNYTHRANFCGGTNLTRDNIGPIYGPPAFDMTTYGADDSCVWIEPLDDEPTWHEYDPLPVGRTMGTAIILPDLTTLIINGAEFGTAGYGDDGVADWLEGIGGSYAEGPTLRPILFNPDAPAGEQWTDEGYDASDIPRVYHSTAVLVTDGSILIAGSNPNADVETRHYATEYRVERFYPHYFEHADRRPKNDGLPSNLTYGGDPWTIELSSDDLAGDAAANMNNTMFTLVRPGFSTHAIQFGQRAIKLESSYESLSNGGARFHVSQLPPNPAIFAPGTALLHVVVDGVPSVGKMVMVGSGEIGPQETLDVGALPENRADANSDPETENSEDGDSSAASLTASYTFIGAFALMLLNLF